MTPDLPFKYAIMSLSADGSKLKGGVQYWLFARPRH